ncbi:sucrose-6-phosphate hydrolase [Klebsiella oxytoca]|nr:sucrose-6-phosphate hydrolase [Klebsiella oxytoca]
MSPMALMPDEEYDRNGCYSGSAVDNNGTLTLCYTGNVKFADGGRTAWQCLATENADGTFRKIGPVLPLPEGYTGHVRDPKVWRHEGTLVHGTGRAGSAKARQGAAVQLRRPPSVDE